MQFGVCPLSIVPVRAETDHTSEMLTQLLYGEHFKVLERRKKWSKIRIAFDKKEGWAPNNQLTLITAEVYQELETNEPRFTSDIVSHICKEEHILMPVVLGSNTNVLKILDHGFEGNSSAVSKQKSGLVETAIMYLTAPYQKGGKTPFGIDCSGFVQMVYKINGFQLFRDADEQSKQGIPLSFIEESEPGDLAFFDNHEGVIDHVGIILKDNYIIHVSGSVRIDRLDHTGIFNTTEKQYSHKLRVIKKIA